ncbi:hypothetical protein, variant 2 [Aphanomyces astaci]|uniref:Uncharacterized protein n=1 Tax=Aphanomyces astaci TaxID=112090 RepID=W4GC88_APHAT|nr:hypothetical protein, variant 2 [Aphanomyces astaci]ETV76679.1 hypothetical protein, variant 2 [Aphanomyces astaci]|eukprot:XP_009833591.1 hypothetical protein, variant 2 [Aphanomyces astaci]
MHRDTQRAFASQGVLTLRARKSAASTGLLLGAAVGVYMFTFMDWRRKQRDLLQLNATSKTL